MTEEERIFSGKLYWPGEPELVEMKKKGHRLSQEFNNLYEDDPRRTEILNDLLGAFGEGSFFHGPIRGARAPPIPVRAAYIRGISA